MLKQRIEAFVTVFLEGKSPETIGTYRRSLNEFERWFAQRKRPFGFRKKDVVAYRNYLTDERCLSPASVSAYLTALRRPCASLVRRADLQGTPPVGGHADSDPADIAACKGADITICAPATSDSKPREPMYEFPGWEMHVKQGAVGIDYVIVNGEVLLEGGEHTGALPGQVLRGPLYQGSR